MRSATRLRRETVAALLAAATVGAVTGFAPVASASAPESLHAVADSGNSADFGHSADFGTFGTFGYKGSSTQERNKAVALHVLKRLFEDGDSSAVDKYIRPDHIQHDPDAADGTEPLEEFVRAKVPCLSSGERGESGEAWRDGLRRDEIKRLRRTEATSAAAALGAEIGFLDAGDHPLSETPELVDRIVHGYRGVNPSHQPEQCDVRPNVLLGITTDCTDLAKRREVRLNRNAGPDLDLWHGTMGEAYVRLHPQTTGTAA